jgi:TRAP-type C4-dicarboxylate transport system permease large subunit
MVLLVMGIFLDAMAMMTLALPVFFPIIVGMDWQGSLSGDFIKLAPIWFGILMVRAQETALITPPLGMNIYVVKGLRSDIALGTVFKGVLPFLIADIPHIALLVAFPILTLYLPSLM